MTRRTFGRTGLEVSPLGFGGAPAAFLNADAAATAALVETLLDRGVNLIDTATMYEGSEQFIGERLSHRRRDYVLVSKCGTKVREINAKPFTPELIAASVDRALRLMKTDVIDVMLLHSCDLATLQADDALDALVRARDAGKIRHCGYSGDNEAAAFAATLPDIAVIETSINIVDQQNIDRVLPACRARDVGLIAKRPIANACWKDESTRTGIYKGYVKPYADRFAKLGLSPGDLGFGGEEGKAWAEIALRFTLAQDIHTAIVGTTRAANAEANLALADKGPLPASAVDRLRAAFRAADNGSWTGQT